MEVGTTFKLYFPAAADEEARLSQATVGVVASRGPEAVLLVEDEPAVRGLALLVLETQGYRVLQARDGDEALRVVEGLVGRLDLLVTDVVMPRVDGRELAELLLARFEGLRVRYVSGYTDDAVVRHGLLKQKVHFLQKLYKPLSLARKVREVFDGRP